MTYKQPRAKKEKEFKYYVTFVPHYNKTEDWKNRRLTAYRIEKDERIDEFSFKKAEKIAKFLKNRGDKAIKINKVKV